MNILQIKQKKIQAEKITMLTAYDYFTALILDEAGIDIILVGDSLGMVFQGKKDTISVKLSEIIYHTKAVKRAKKNALLLADMPFMSYQASDRQAVINAGKLVKLGGAEAIKLEGDFYNAIKKISKAGIPVMAHLGFTPQSVNILGGYKVQGRNNADYIKEASRRVQDAGAFALVLEMVTETLAREITQELEIPVIGCGAGSFCDGQVLVTNDLLGLSTKSPSFAKQYIDLKTDMKLAIADYAKEVKQGIFPNQDFSFK